MILPTLYQKPSSKCRLYLLKLLRLHKVGGVSAQANYMDKVGEKQQCGRGKSTDTASKIKALYIFKINLKYTQSV